MEGLFSVLSVPRVGQVHMFYRARLLHERFEHRDDVADG